MRVLLATDSGVGNISATFKYKLIYNIAGPLPFPIAADLYAAPAFQDLLKTGGAGWYRNFSAYMGSRPKYELYDILADPQELTPLADDPAYKDVLAILAADIKQWQNDTNDDWIIKYTHE